MSEDFKLRHYRFRHNVKLSNRFPVYLKFSAPPSIINSISRGLCPKSSCMKIKSRSNNSLAKRARKGFRGFPVATIAFYGPDDHRANKLVIGIISYEGAEPKLRRWYSDTTDLRSLPEIESEIKAFLKEYDVVSVSMVDRIIGCPHEEGIDYPSGESCPQCLFWRSRDRFTGERIN